MRFCAHCGAQLTPGAAFCAHCGAAVHADAAIGDAPTQAVTTSAGSQPPTGPASGSSAVPAPGSPAAGSTTAGQPANGQWAFQQAAQQHSNQTAGQQFGQPYGQQYGQQPGAPMGAQMGTQSGPQTPHTTQWNAGGQGANPFGSINWMALLPALLRPLLAIVLAMTALGNSWVSGPAEYGESNDPATHASVLPLIGCIGPTLAALAQIALLPQFLGRSVKPLIRAVVPAVLCLPTLIAVLWAVLSTLGGYDSDKLALFGVTLLAFALGLVLAGLSDVAEIVPTKILHLVTAGIAALGVLLSLLAMIQMLTADSYMTPGAKEKWLIGVLSYLFMAAVAGLIIWSKVLNPAMAHGLLWALGGAVALSALLHGWFQDDASLTFVILFRNWHAAPFVALALGLALTSLPALPAGDASARATRATSWVVPGMIVAAVAALLTALALIGARGEEPSGGETWLLVLMFITAMAYGACAWLLKTHALGRIITLGAVALLWLTLAITLLAVKDAAKFAEIFSEGAYLWLPLIAVGALTIPPSVRTVAGPLLPQQPKQSTQQQMQQSAPGVAQR